MRLATLTAALVAAGLAVPAHAAPPPDMAALLEKMQNRLDQLEARNTELEKEVKNLKSQNEAVEKGLNSDRLSQYEPELTSRLKAVEKDALDMKKAARKIDALDGLQVGASLTTVAQRPWGLPKDTQDGTSQLNYRADVTVGLPLDPIGDVEQKIFAHFRMGQGLGLNAPFSNLGVFSSAPNAVAFRASGANPDDSVAILGQAWYQASIPMPLGGFKPRSRETLEVTFGKMDIFGFFDQNAAAGDESRQFLNSIFVHNPMLDAGGQIGVDANGFQPGFVASYYNYYAKPTTWRLSLGVFGTGRGANYQRFFSTPLVIGQAETQVKWMGGLTGNYRIYAWQQGQGTDLNGATAKHTGFGISADQRFGDGITVFGRYGHITKGSVPFDRAVTLGSEFSGSYWSQAGDAVGLALGWMRSSKDYRLAGGTHDLLGNDNDPTAVAPLADNINFMPRGAERVAELYYRHRITKQFELTPNFQWVSRPAANPDAASIKIFGLRAQLAY